MAITVTQQIGSQSLRGQDAIVHLNSSDALTYLPSLAVGQVCTIVSSSSTGNISFVDYPGSTFHITPTMPTGNLASSSTPGVLAAADTISIAV
jgi:hypothetical protein